MQRVRVSEPVWSSSSYYASKKREIPTEAQEQIAVVEYCDAQNIPVFHIPNGGQRDKACAANLKRQGVRAGVPDLCIPLARLGYHGLYIEMKRRKGYQIRPTQREWLARLNKEGYLARVCAGADSAIELVRQYVDGESAQQCGRN